MLWKSASRREAGRGCPMELERERAAWQARAEAGAGAGTEGTLISGVNPLGWGVLGRIATVESSMAGKEKLMSPSRRLIGMLFATWPSCISPSDRAPSDMLTSSSMMLGSIRQTRPLGAITAVLDEKDMHLLDILLLARCQFLNCVPGVGGQLVESIALASTSRNYPLSCR